jgi:hypothetical protein
VFPYRKYKNFKLGAELQYIKGAMNNKFYLIIKIHKPHNILKHIKKLHTKSFQPANGRASKIALALYCVHVGISNNSTEVAVLRKSKTFFCDSVILSDISTSESSSL